MPRFNFAWLVLGLLLIGSVFLGSKLFASNAGDSETRNMIRLSLAWYAAALGLMMWLRPADWRTDTALGRTARWCWTWACLCFLIHLGLAFHYFYQWSHARAFQHTRDVSGVGEGLYVSYLFTVLWVADAASWWLAPLRYAARSAWIDRLLHGFMLLIVFNGTVVYASGPIRWIAIIGFLALAAEWIIFARLFEHGARQADSV